MIKNADIDRYDLFDLAGLSKISPEQKNKYLDQLENLIIREFFLRLILELDDQEEIKKINSMLKEKQTLKNIFTYLNQNNPGFYEKFIVFIREKKAEFIVNYFNGVIKDCKEKIEIVLKNNASEKTRIELKKKLDLYLQARNLVVAEDWEKLLLLVS
jgi:hypothetical protein